MKVLAILVLAFVAAQGASVRNPRNLPDRIVLYQDKVAPELREMIKREAESRIVGGVEAVPHSEPHQCYMIIDNAFFCGCSIISSQTILTAAHCTDDALEFEITMGDHKRSDNEGTEVTVNSTDYIIHPEWRPFLLNNDYSLIYLSQPISFTPEIKTIPLAPSNGPLYVGELAKVTGWGRPSDSVPSVSDVLRVVEAPVIDNARCSAVYGSTVTENTICIDTAGGKGSCNGDSGGPLSLVINGVQTQIGIVSFGSSSGCEKGLPAGFARITTERDWIDANTR